MPRNGPGAGSFSDLGATRTEKPAMWRAFFLHQVRREGSLFVSNQDGHAAFVKDGCIGVRHLDAETKSLGVLHAEVQVV